MLPCRHRVGNEPAVACGQRPLVATGPVRGGKCPPRQGECPRRRSARALPRGRGTRKSAEESQQRRPTTRHAPGGTPVAWWHSAATTATPTLPQGRCGPPTGSGTRRRRRFVVGLGPAQAGASRRAKRGRTKATPAGEPFAGGGLPSGPSGDGPRGSTLCDRQWACAGRGHPPRRTAWRGVRGTASFALRSPAVPSCRGPRDQACPDARRNRRRAAALPQRSPGRSARLQSLRIAGKNPPPSSGGESAWRTKKPWSRW